MARIRIASTSGASENTIVFSPAGGHSHNGRNSSLIDSTAYSIYDFSPTFVGTEVNPDRSVRQENNRIAFEDLIKRVVNNSVLAPAGIRLEPGSLNGSLIIANTITANQLAANTITAAEISAGTITANELSSNIVLINNRITSQNWNGIIESNGSISNIGTVGWAITSAGEAVFDSSKIRGSVAANSLLTPNLTISNTGAISSTSFNVTAGGNVTATNANITGTITSGSGAIGGWTIDTARIYGGSTYLYSNGSMAIGATTIASNGQITNGGYTLSAAGALTATGANVTGTINADFGRIGGLELSGSDLFAGDYVGDNSYGQYVKLDSVGEIQVYRKDFNYGIGEYYVRVDIMGSEPGIKVLGTADGSYNETRIVSSFVSTKDVILNGTSLITRLAGKANTHSHPYASDPHNHSNYVATAGDTMTGTLFGTSIDMSNNLRYGGQVYSDAANGYAEFGAVGAPGSVGAYVFRINQDETLYNKQVTRVSTDRPIYINAAGTLFTGPNHSSLKYKEGVIDANIDVNNFLNVDVVNFYYKDEYWNFEGAPEKEKQLGVIVEQLDSLGLTDLIDYSDGVPNGLNSELIPFYLLQTCKIQQVQIDDLKARIQALEGV
jgi:hypothetical protein